MANYMNTKAAANEAGMSPDGVRYYEQIGLIPHVQRDKNGFRIFSDKDMKWLKFVRRMRQAGLSINTLSAYMRYIQADDPATIPSRKKLLQTEADHLKLEIDEKQAVYDDLTRKIGYYDYLQELEEQLVND